MMLSRRWCHVSYVYYNHAWEISGVLDCEGLYKRIGEMVGMGIANDLALLSAVHRKNLFREGYFYCDGSVDVDVAPDEVRLVCCCSRGVEVFFQASCVSAICDFYVMYTTTPCSGFSLAVVLPGAQIWRLWVPRLRFDAGR